MIDSFSNSERATHTLPTVQGMHFEALSPHYIKVVCIQLIAGLAVPLLAIGLMFMTLQGEAENAITSPMFIYGLPVVLIAAGCFMFLAGIREARRKAYCIREHDIAFRHGLFIRRLLIQPLLRVQHVEVSQNPLEARWDLATVKLYSAGGFRYTFAIPGLPRPDAERIHQYVVNYQEAHHE